MFLVFLDLNIISLFLMIALIIPGLFVYASNLTPLKPCQIYLLMFALNLVALLSPSSAIMTMSLTMLIPAHSS
jgi:hypothetical protein